MNAKFKRGARHNFLVIDMKGAADNVDVGMLIHNEIESLLPVSVDLNDGEESLYYEISSMWSLAMLYENREMDRKHIEILMKAVSMCVNNSLEYLLDENNIVLSPEYIYMDPETNQTRFIYYPEHNGNFRDEVFSLVEYIMDKVNHEDTAGVTLAYSLFKWARCSNLTMEMIDKIIENTDRESNDMIAEKKKEAVSDLEEPFDDCEDGRENGRENIFPEESVKEEKRTKGIFKKLLGKINITETHRKNEKEETIQSSDAAEVDWPVLPLPYDKEKEADEGYGKTMLLRRDTDIKEGVPYLEDKNKNRLLLQKPSVKVGKNAELADVVINEKSVSRLHCQIFTEAGKLMIKDLGSTNGTFVNGLILSDDESIEILDNDELQIGNNEYILHM